MSRPGRWVGRLLQTLVAAGILYFLFRRIPVAEVGRALAEANAGGVVAALVATALLQWAAARRLQLLTAAQGLDLSTGHVLEINLASRFWGLFVPGGNVTGVVIRVLRFGRQPGERTAASVALAVDRILATAAGSALGLAFWLLERPHHGGGLAFVAAGGLALLPALLFWRSVGAAVLRFVPRQFETLRAAVLRSRLTPRVGVHVLAQSLAVHLLGTAAYFALATALGLGLDLVTLGWVRAALLLATLAPVSVAGVGLREASALVLLRPYGVPDERTLAFSLAVFAVTVLGVGLAGGLLEAWRWLGPRRS